MDISISKSTKNLMNNENDESMGLEDALLEKSLQVDGNLLWCKQECRDNEKNYAPNLSI